MTKKVSIDERQIRKIVRSPQKVELSSDNLSKFAVILQRLSKERRCLYLLTARF